MTTSTIDDKISHLKFGKWHLIFFSQIFWMVLAMSMINAAVVFMQETPPFICNNALFTSNTNWSFTQIQNFSFSTPKNSKGKFDGCYMYEKNYSLYAGMDYASAVQHSGNPSDNKIKCQTSYNFNPTDGMFDTVVTQWNLVCDKKINISTMAFVYMAGFFVGCLLAGPLADRFGRKPITMITQVSMEGSKKSTSETVVLDTTGSRKSFLRTVVTLMSCLLAGIVFGFASEKGRVFEPATIRLQMVFEKWIMMKMFVAAIASSVFVFVVLSLCPWSFVRRKWEAAVADFESTVDKKNIVAVITGCFILGIGMTFAGACPGMVLPQFGAWTHNAAFTLIGAMLGGLVYGLIHDKFYHKIFPDNRFVLPTALAKLFHVKYWIIGVPLLLVTLAVVVVLEILMPWKDDVSWKTYSSSYTHNDGAPSIFQFIAWPPSICGILIGLMQGVIILAIGDTLGGSSSYITVVSQPFRAQQLQTKFPYLAKKQNGLANWWQVFYVVGGIVGGLISSQLSQTAGQVQGVPVYFGLIGGFLLVFGARIASGCTSGHGLSGIGLLMIASFVGVPCMFAGGIGTAFIMKATGELYRLCLSTNC